jgi:hypothetical protein
MKSYMLSTLAMKFATAELDAFKKAHPHDWLLWEPGAWRPTQASTIVLQTPPPQQPATVGEALALALTPSNPASAQVTLGRGEECDLQINDGTLSGLHLLFMPTADGGWTVRDAQSKNGSRVGNVVLEAGVPVALQNGSPIYAAHVALTFYTPAGMLARLRR